MNHGLAAVDLNQLTNVFSQYKEINRVTLFGSRATSTYRKGSDVDLVISGVNPSFGNLLNISNQLDELGTLYSFDVVDIHRLKNNALPDHINRVGVIIYQADGQP